ncbi:MAG: DUF1707 domain-containing protein [Gemmatimonadota bacterium]|nr:DUF1707 domain-containing protein [Gemmatimonadota bacterium]
MSTPDESHRPPPLERSRQKAVDELCEHFANDRLTVEEFERRVDSAHQARTSAELRGLLDDLPQSRNTAVTHGRESSSSDSETRYTLAEPDRVKDRGIVIAVLGGTGRKGRWSPARSNFVLAVMGGAELDFREAVLPPGVTEVQIYTVWGGVDIVVPPDIHVESHGFALLGGFEHAAGDAVDPAPGTPTLRITGMAIMGGVDINVRRPGETVRDARRRRRLERKQRRRNED